MGKVRVNAKKARRAARQKNQAIKAAKQPAKQPAWKLRQAANVVGKSVNSVDRVVDHIRHDLNFAARSVRNRINHNAAGVSAKEIMDVLTARGIDITDHLKATDAVVSKLTPTLAPILTVAAPAAPVVAPVIAAAPAAAPAVATAAEPAATPTTPASPTPPAA